MTTPIPDLLPLSSTDCGCCGPATSPGVPPISDEVDTESIAHYRVSGLSCGGCVNTVTSAIEALPQVDSVHIDLVSGGASTITVAGAASREIVQQAIEQSGYAIATS